MPLLNPYMLFPPAGGGGDDIKDVVDAASGDKGWWPTNIAANLCETSGGTSGDVVDTDPVGRVDPVSGSIDLVQSTAAARPTWVSANGSLSFDGSDDGMWATESAGWGSAMTIAFAFKSSDSQGILVGSGTNYILFMRDANSSTTLDNGSGTPSYRIDGAAFSGSTRDDLHTALADGSWHVVYAENVDLSAAGWDTVKFGDYGAANSTSGEYGHFVIVADQNSTNRGLIEAQIADDFGVTLP